MARNPSQQTSTAKQGFMSLKRNAPTSEFSQTTLASPRLFGNAIRPPHSPPISTVSSSVHKPSTSTAVTASPARHFGRTVSSFREDVTLSSLAATEDGGNVRGDKPASGAGVPTTGGSILIPIVSSRQHAESQGFESKRKRVEQSPTGSLRNPGHSPSQSRHYYDAGSDPSSPRRALHTSIASIPVSSHSDVARRSQESTLSSNVSGAERQFLRKPLPSPGIGPLSPSKALFAAINQPDSGSKSRREPTRNMQGTLHHSDQGADAAGRFGADDDSTNRASKSGTKTSAEVRKSANKRENSRLSTVTDEHEEQSQPGSPGAASMGISADANGRAKLNGATMQRLLHLSDLVCTVDTTIACLFSSHY
jgi:hypothetical protein